MGTGRGAGAEGAALTGAGLPVDVDGGVPGGILLVRGVAAEGLLAGVESFAGFLSSSSGFFFLLKNDNYLEQLLKTSK